MRRAAFSDLETTFGRNNVAKMASAYESALLHLTGGSLRRAVDRETRLAIVVCLVAEARRGQFEPGALEASALSVAARLATSRGALALEARRGET
jgi:hypothetical protein